MMNDEVNVMHHDGFEHLMTTFGSCAILASYGRQTWLPLLIILLAAIAASAVFFPWACILLVPALFFVILFFRDPERVSTASKRALISPADGQVVEIATVEEDEFIERPAIKIAIFMSVFNVHVNRAPCEAKVEWVHHISGRFINAFAANASIENERVLLALRDTKKRPVLIKLIAGLIARRIICRLEAGDALQRGERLGMIRFGSRVEVLVPADAGFDVHVKLNDRVHAGRTSLGEWRRSA